MHDDSENWKQEIHSLKNDLKNMQQQQQNMQQQQQEIIKHYELQMHQLKTRDTNSILNSIVT